MINQLLNNNIDVEREAQAVNEISQICLIAFATILAGSLVIASQRPVLGAILIGHGVLYYTSNERDITLQTVRVAHTLGQKYNTFRCRELIQKLENRPHLLQRASFKDLMKSLLKQQKEIDSRFQKIGAALTFISENEHAILANQQQLLSHENVRVPNLPFFVKKEQELRTSLEKGIQKKVDTIFKHKVAIAKLQKTMVEDVNRALITASER